MVAGHVGLGLVDVTHRVGPDEAVEGESALSPQIDELGNERTWDGVALEDAGDGLAGSEGVARQLDGAGNGGDEAECALSAQRRDCGRDDAGRSRGVQGSVSATHGDPLDLVGDLPHGQASGIDYMLDRLEDPAEQLVAALHAFMIYHVEDRAATVAFQREVVRLADQESMAKGAELRQRYFTRVRDVIQAGIDDGVFRKVDPTVDALLMFGSAQWAWTWFHPDGDRPIDAIGSALVDLVLGSLLIDRDCVAELSDPAGRSAKAVRDAIEAVAENEGAADS